MSILEKTQQIDRPGAVTTTSPDELPCRLALTLKSTSFRAGVIAIVLLVGGFILWNVATDKEWVSPLVVAPPDEVGKALKDMFATGAVWKNLGATAYVTLIGFFVATAAALLVSFIFVFSESLQKAIYPFLVIIQTFPKVAIAPLIIASFGYGLLPKVVLAALMAFFPVLVNAMVGLTNINVDQLNLFKSMRANTWQVLFKLRIPNAISYILPALNTALVLSLIGTIVAEFVSARQGLGFAIQSATQTGSVATTYALLIVLGVFGAMIWVVMAILNRVFKNYKQ
ncbi:ABC transporter permease [Paeniglutamicibacter sp. ABSL32-1]|uniref:ABC transporter permease n=1 Tax=Paeniglutamicibacter quisquiliarum TaxID=2849498 RepID=UPI001C2CFE42|nr:ABC transporter permease [Paeniglutamicibacter quisquiliarum]MBV1777635.1 ABC transporter permease [Paeniglutamicibacter quisquiliarum]